MFKRHLNCLVQTVVLNTTVGTPDLLRNMLDSVVQIITQTVRFTRDVLKDHCVEYSCIGTPDLLQNSRQIITFRKTVRFMCEVLKKVVVCETVDQRQYISSLTVLAHYLILADYEDGLQYLYTTANTPSTSLTALLPACSFRAFLEDLLRVCQIVMANIKKGKQDNN